jgi:hypothetical protein
MLALVLLPVTAVLMGFILNDYCISLVCTLMVETSQVVLHEMLMSKMQLLLQNDTRGYAAAP